MCKCCEASSRATDTITLAIKEILVNKKRRIAVAASLWLWALSGLSILSCGAAASSTLLQVIGVLLIFGPFLVLVAGMLIVALCKLTYDYAKGSD